MVYRWLVEKGAPGVLFCHLQNGNHEFVIVGAEPPPWNVPASLNPQVPLVCFGRKAVWCDPWYGAQFAVALPDEWSLGVRSIVHQTLGETPGARQNLTVALAGVSVNPFFYHP